MRCSLILLFLAAMMVGCSTTDPIRDQFDGDSEKVIAGAAAFNRIESAQAAGQQASGEDWAAMREFVPAALRMAEGWEAAYSSAYERGKQATRYKYRAHIWIGDRVLWGLGILATIGIGWFAVRLFLR